MSIEKIHLNKLLKLIHLPENELRSALRSDIREEHNKNNNSGGGGNFYEPIWSDIKKHVTGIKDLTASTKERVESNHRRKRLYPLLTKGFLELWTRGNNQNVKLLPYSPKGQYTSANGQLTVKIQNIMAISINDEERLGYPYWFEKPPINDEAARIGLWVLSKALSDQNSQNIRIFDIIRSEYFSLNTHPLQGNEENLLLAHFKRIKKLRDKLKLEYN